MREVITFSEHSMSRFLPLFDELVYLLDGPPWWAKKPTNSSDFDDSELLMEAYHDEHMDSGGAGTAPHSVCLSGRRPEDRLRGFSGTVQGLALPGD